MRTRPDTKLLERLRGWRNSPRADLTLDGPLDRATRDLKQRVRSLGALGSAWREIVPSELADRTVLVSLARGVLVIRCADAACKFELDRWLRAGGEMKVIARAVTSLNRIRLVL